MKKKSHSKKAGVDQQQAVGGLMSLLQYGSFFRNRNGSNNLPSICELRKILNLPNDFILELKQDGIESFCQSGKKFL